MMTAIIFFIFVYHIVQEVYSSFGFVEFATYLLYIYTHNTW